MKYNIDIFRKIILAGFGQHSPTAYKCIRSLTPNELRSYSRLAAISSRVRISLFEKINP